MPGRGLTGSNGRPNMPPKGAIGCPRAVWFGGSTIRMETQMSERILGRAAKLAAAFLVATAVLAITAGAASATITYTPIYKNILSPLPGNVPSQAFEATSTSEFGGQVAVSGASKDNTKVSVAMSSWACQSGNAVDGNCVKLNTETFPEPVTLKIYLAEADGSVGPKIAQVTQTFHMPYRPTTSAMCRAKGEKEQEEDPALHNEETALGGWGTQCFHGKLFKITFALKGVYLSNENNVIISASYNTSDYGAQPTGCTGANACPYDSLNVGVTGTPTVGSLPLPNDAYLSSLWGGAYCPSNQSTGPFRLDPGCWTGYQPEFEVTTG